LGATGSSARPPEHSWSPIVELRQYILRPGRRDVLIDLFDSQLVEPQEETGMKVIGQFRDLDDPDKFVWFRGFRDMPERARALGDFYGGAVWRSHSKEANATMVDVDDVLLLRPAQPDSAFTLEVKRTPRSLQGSGPGFVQATIMQLEVPAEETGIISFFERAIAPAVSDCGGSILGYFVTESAENTFPSLPVRAGEEVFVWCAGFATRETLERVSDDDSEARLTAVQAPALTRPPHVLRLAPTSRSLLHGHSRACCAVAHDPEP